MIKHEWSVTPKEAIEIQNRLRTEVRIEPFGKKIRYIAGCDVSLNLYSTTIYAGFVVLSYPDMVMVDHAVVVDETRFPYVPGLLSFREIPALMKAWEKLQRKLKKDTRGVCPDIIMVDGQGIAHPRRLGIASHLGVMLDMPTIGCAKNVLTGIYEKPKNVGDASPLIDPKTNEMIGTILQSKARSKPLVISAGHKITQEESLEIIRTCLKGYKLPEPTRLAHITMNEYRKGLLLP
jgi:deoxyribonuclease V